jgi:hypothetical protein
MGIVVPEVDFSEAGQPVAATYATGGCPAYRVAVLLRVMILQHLYFRTRIRPNQTKSLNVGLATGSSACHWPRLR